MANYEIPFEDTLSIFEGLIAKYDIDRYIRVKVLTNNSLKKDVIKVSKANDIAKFETNNDIYLVVNESIFEQLTEEQKVIAVDEALASIHYDTEKDKLTVVQPDVKTHSGVLLKYGYDKYDVLRESVKTLYNAQKEEAE